MGQSHLNLRPAFLYGTWSLETKQRDSIQFPPVAPIHPDHVNRAVGAWDFMGTDDMGRCPMLIW